MLVPLFKSNPRKIFLFDAFGAGITAFFLLALLRPFHEFIGLPQTILTVLGLCAIVIGLYSLFCYRVLQHRWNTYLLFLSMINSMYCVITGVLVFIYFSEMTFLGVGYFVVEIAIISILVHAELHYFKLNKS